MAKQDIAIRDAVDADIVKVAPFFRAIVSAGETYAYPDDLDDRAIAELWLERPPGRTIVALDSEGTILGSAKFGPNRPGRGSHIATASFMVDPAAQGQGVGRALGEAVLNLARAQGFHGMQFNAVVETNKAAVSLWLSLGFTIMTTIPEAFDHPRFGLVGLHVMYQKF
jgi:GNAT superfamily N-acetyltransferase